ncbi:MAG: hypothetical protein Kow0068_13870 [Marinilabiliales bacterium]
MSTYFRASLSRFCKQAGVTFNKILDLLENGEYGFGGDIELKKKYYQLYK